MTPILIFVSSTDWKATPFRGSILSERDKFLISEIKLAGGINHMVPPGIYYFNIVPYRGQNVASLTPVPREKNIH